ncbi:hypothetical protein CDAR_452161 [Caerostris darwini]|uniref:Uncharacterized protein n=1 Tax=Caerostris darwini TaxID=1538125 RepID=A0AAV4PRX7_9ARAC|nr:hypothetical protein CDAR_452161 [Caerostris darwini]
MCLQPTLLQALTPLGILHGELVHLHVIEMHTRLEVRYGKRGSSYFVYVKVWDYFAAVCGGSTNGVCVSPGKWNSFPLFIVFVDVDLSQVGGRNDYFIELKSHLRDCFFFVCSREREIVFFS